jgi:two-component system response regulator (stage 0 sporulation protein F)
MENHVASSQDAEDRTRNVAVHEGLFQDSLREAIEKIKAGIDLEKTKRIIQERFGMSALETIDLREMRAIAHEGQVAFRCRMTARWDMAVMVDFHGNCLMAFPEKGAPQALPEPRVSDTRKPLIFVADDDEGCLDVLIKMIKMLGYDAFGVRGGKEAIEVYGSMRNKIDLVILDMNMPFNGEKTYEKLRSIDAGTRILLISGYTEDEKIRALLSQKHSWFITKPFNLASLGAKIDSILKQRPGVP